MRCSEHRDEGSDPGARGDEEAWATTFEIVKSTVGPLERHDITDLQCSHMRLGKTLLREFDPESDEREIARGADNRVGSGEDGVGIGNDKRDELTWSEGEWWWMCLRLTLIL